MAEIIPGIRFDTNIIVLAAVHTALNDVTSRLFLLNLKANVNAMLYTK